MFSFARPSHHLITLGSSGTEAIDYVIGKHRQFHPMWASGWSARGLRNKDTIAYVGKILDPLPRQSVVLLNFGAVDTVMNARHRAANGFTDFPTMVRQAADGIIETRRRILDMGFERVLPVFFGPTIDLDQTYWNNFGTSPQLPSPMMGKFYHQIFTLVEKECATLDIFDAATEGEAGSYLLKKQYCRDRPNLHLDFIKSHHLIAGELRKIAGIPRPRWRRLKKRYPHVQVGIKTLIAEGRPRQNTCV